ncbi:MAG: Eco57I restriction-modification methylase domain-containing protein, partial [Chloroflexi bacterium]|nr:Eco57I restriction-modification methylase domain-containing protein [Chloroflexota bacterium]
YGVDLNPMAVELAKLSLWLDSFTVGAPLSFLDHHLKVGNSLIGARVQEVRAELEKTAAGQYDMFGGPFAGLLTATELMRGVGLRTDATFDEVQESAGLYADFERAILPYKRVLDLWVSRYFGNKHADEFLRLYGTKALRAVMNEGQGLSPEYRQAVQTARQLWKEKRFFHWDLEFPEVFIDLERSDWKTNPGFDVVVGNPPYYGFKIWGSDKCFLIYVQHRYEVYDWHADIFYYFVELGIQSLKEETGRLGFITSRYFRRSPSGQKLRRLIAPGLRIFVDFTDIPVFEDHSVHSSILLYAKSSNDGVFLEATYTPHQLKQIGDAPYQDTLRAWLATNKGFVLRGQALFVESRPLELDQRSICRLGDLVTIRAGMQSGRDKVFVGRIEMGPSGFVGRLPDGALVPLEREIVHVFVKNSDIERYVHVPKRYCLYVPNGLTEKQVLERFPGAHTFLSAYKDELMARRSTFKVVTEDNWWEWMNSTDVHLQPAKLITPYRASENRFSLDTELMLGSIDVTVLALKSTTDVSLNYILGLLNSRLCQHTYHSYAKQLGGGIYDYYPKNLSKVPIRRIAFTTPEEERRALVEEGKGLVEAALTPALAALGRPLSQTWERRTGGEGYAAFLASPLGRWLDARLTADPEQADVVHDLLAYLAEQMIEMHKEKQDEARGFLDWLAGYTGLPIEDWRLKTNLRGYYQHDWAEMQRLLDANRRQIKKVDVVGREASERIKGEWEVSTAKLRPLLARIAATDRLIDLIVYRLYGLTEGEVAVVEGLQTDAETDKRM